MKIKTIYSECKVSERALSSAIIIAEQALWQRAGRDSTGKKEIDITSIDVRVDRQEQLTVRWTGYFLNKNDELIEESGKEEYSSRDY